MLMPEGLAALGGLPRVRPIVIEERGSRLRGPAGGVGFIGPQAGRNDGRT